MPSVSVIMGVHSGERTVRSALESIRVQTFSDWECIICDDGSTDATWETLCEYTQREPRFRLLRNSTNRGLAYTLNRCIDLASGKYLARQDADDSSDAKRLAVLALYLDKNPDVTVVGTYAGLVDDRGMTWGELRHPLNPVKMDWLKGPCLVHPSVMMRTGPIIEVGKYNEHAIRLEDYDLWLRLVSNGCKIVNIPEKLYNLHWGQSDYSRRKLKYRFGEMRLVLQALSLFNSPPSCYLYLFKPFFTGLLPKRLVYLHHKRKFARR